MAHPARHGTRQQRYFNHGEHDKQHDGPVGPQLKRTHNGPPVSPNFAPLSIRSRRSPRPRGSAACRRRLKRGLDAMLDEALDRGDLPFLLGEAKPTAMQSAKMALRRLPRNLLRAIHRAGGKVVIEPATSLLSKSIYLNGCQAAGLTTGPARPRGRRVSGHRPDCGCTKRHTSSMPASGKAYRLVRCGGRYGKANVSRPRATVRQPASIRIGVFCRELQPLLSRHPHPPELSHVVREFMGNLKC